MTERVLLKDLCLDGGTQTRVAMNQERVAEYAELMKDGESFPPIVVFFDGTTYWPADGFHRAHAAKQAGRVHIEADVRKGSKADCIKCGAAANKPHDQSGLRRTKEDKRRSVEMMLSLLIDEGQNWSSTMIADHCGVSRTMVDAIRPAIMAGREDPAAPRLTKSGRMVRPVGNPKPKTPTPVPVPTQPFSPPMPEPAPEPKPPSGRGRPMKDSTVRLDGTIRSMVEDGKSSSEIARSLDVPSSRVSEAKSRLGLLPKRDTNPLAGFVDYATRVHEMWETAEDALPPLWARATAEQRTELIEGLKLVIKRARRLVSGLNNEAPESETEQ